MAVLAGFSWIRFARVQRAYAIGQGNVPSGLRYLKEQRARFLHNDQHLLDEIQAAEQEQHQYGVRRVIYGFCHKDRNIRIRVYVGQTDMPYVIRFQRHVNQARTRVRQHLATGASVESLQYPYLEDLWNFQQSDWVILPLQLIPEEAGAAEIAQLEGLWQRRLKSLHPRLGYNRREEGHWHHVGPVAPAKPYYPQP